MVVPKTLAKFLERNGQGEDVKLIGLQVKNWWRWMRSGVEISVINVFTFAFEVKF
jgi:hypothetical protein